MDETTQALAWLNGQFLPAADLAISPVDAGFVQGTTVAEQLRTFGGHLFHLDDHLARLEHSFEAIGVDPGVDRGRMTALAEELASRNHRLLECGNDLGLSIFVTPGPYAGYGAIDAAGPTVCLHTYPLQFRFWSGKYRTGQSLVTTPIQQVPPHCWPPGLKCRSRMHYYLADREAARIERGARAVLLDHRGLVTEASTANIIVYRQNVGLMTPPRAAVLQGISLRVVGDLAAAMGMPLAEEAFGPDSLSSADEVFLSSTPFCLLPVTRFNGRPIGNGRPGPVFGRLLAAWNNLVGVDIAAQAERFASRK